MNYFKANMKKYLTQNTVNIITLGGLGLIALSALTTPSRPNNGFSSKQAHIEFDEQMQSNKFLDHEIARLRHCGENKMRGWQFHPSSPSAWICTDDVPYYGDPAPEPGVPYYEEELPAPPMIPFGD